MNPAAYTIQAVWRFLQRFEARVLLGVMLAAAALLAFLNIGGEVAEGETSAFDRRLLLMLRTPGDLHDPIGSRKLEEVVRDITALGGTMMMTVITIIGVLAFLSHRKHRHAAVLAATVLLAWGSSQATKLFYARPRPDLAPHLVEVYSNSFPSGHSTLSAATYLTLAMLIASLEPRRGTKVLAYAVACVVLAAVGFSRVYLGVHWPSDVIAGWCLGAMWALVGWIGLRLAGGRARGAG